MSEEKIFKLEAPYQPTGDQPQAIEALVKGFWKDVYDGQRDRAVAETHTGHRP